MSADNGIYILECKDQYRVIYAHAIDNLFYSHLNPYNDELVPTRIIESYGKSKYTRNRDLARMIAFSMEKFYQYTEYGIKTFTIDKTWYQVLQEAKRLAPLEIEAIRNKTNNDGRWDYDIKRLEEIINR